jgi:hypothetical protein
VSVVTRRNGFAFAERALAIATEFKFLMYCGEASLLLGWALVAMGDRDGLARLAEGLEQRVAAAPIGSSLARFIAADGYLMAGELDRAVALVDEALRFSATTGERLWEVEGLRLRAALHLRGAARDSSRLHDAEACARRAIELARAWSARIYELRAAVLLAQVVQARRGTSEAKGLEPRGTERGSRREGDGDWEAILRQVYDGFEEGHDLPDLVEARSLLSGSQSLTDPSWG